MTYHAQGLSALRLGKTIPVQWLLTGADKEVAVIDGLWLPSQEACRVREGQITKIQIIMK